MADGTKTKQQHLLLDATVSRSRCLREATEQSQTSNVKPSNPAQVYHTTAALTEPLLFDATDQAVKALVAAADYLLSAAGTKPTAGKRPYAAATSTAASMMLQPSREQSLITAQHRQAQQKPNNSLHSFVAQHESSTICHVNIPQSSALLRSSSMCGRCNSLLLEAAGKLLKNHPLHQQVAAPHGAPCLL
jgi:hypothetical protein